MEEACELAKPTWEMEGPAEAREAAGEGGRGVSEPRVETALWPRWPEAGEVGLEEEKGTLPRALSCSIWISTSTRAIIASQRARIEWKPFVGGQSRVGLTASSTGASSMRPQATPASAKALQPACERRVWQAWPLPEKEAG